MRHMVPLTRPRGMAWMFGFLRWPWTNVRGRVGGCGWPSDAPPRMSAWRARPAADGGCPLPRRSGPSGSSPRRGPPRRAPPRRTRSPETRRASPWLETTSARSTCIVSGWRVIRWSAPSWAEERAPRSSRSAAGCRPCTDPRPSRSWGRGHRKAAHTCLARPAGRQQGTPDHTRQRRARKCCTCPRDSQRSSCRNIRLGPMGPTCSYQQRQSRWKSLASLASQAAGHERRRCLSSALADRSLCSCWSSTLKRWTLARASARNWCCPAPRTRRRSSSTPRREAAAHNLAARGAGSPPPERSSCVSPARSPRQPPRSQRRDQR